MATTVAVAPGSLGGRTVDVTPPRVSSTVQIAGAGDVKTVAATTQTVVIVAT